MPVWWKIKGAKSPMFGKHHSEESKGRMSEQAKGENNPMFGVRLFGKDNPFFGRHHSEETRRKISKSCEGRYFSEEQIRKLNEHWRGKHHTKEVKEMLSIKKRGEKNPNWKGGVSPLIERIKSCFKYRQWRSDIFTRDDFTCQTCGKRGGIKIEADHYPKSFSEIFYENKIKSLEQALECEEFWNINNGRTLCKECHKKTDSYGYRFWRLWHL